MAVLFMDLILFPLIFLFVLFSSYCFCDSCIFLPSSSVCFGVLPNNFYANIPEGECIQSMELQIDTRLYSVLTPSCRLSLSQYNCGSVYKPCNASTSLVPKQIC